MSKRIGLIIILFAVLLVSVASTGNVIGIDSMSVPTSQSINMVEYDQCNGGENLFQSPRSSNVPSLNQC